MHELIAIFLVACGRLSGAQRYVGAVEQYLAVYAFCYPTVVQLLAHILQFEEELLVRETQQIAGCLVAIPAGSLQ